ncbi:uncharacterized protein LOC144101517 [Amblyomma americanum]
MPTDEKAGGKAPDVVPPADQAAATSTAVVPYEEKGSVKITVDVPPVDKPGAAPPRKPGFFSRWFGSKKAPAPIEATKAKTTDEPFVAVVPEEHPGGTVSIDMPTVDEPSRKTSTEVPSPHITSEVVSVDVTSLEKPAEKIEAGVLSAEKPIGEIEGGVFPADKPSGAATVEMFSTDKAVEKTEAQKSGGKTTVDVLSADRPESTVKQISGSANRLVFLVVAFLLVIVIIGLIGALLGRPGKNCDKIDKPQPHVTPDQKPSRNYTLVCVFEYLRGSLWSKDIQCTDYVFIRMFSLGTNKGNEFSFEKNVAEFKNLSSVDYQAALELEEGIRDNFAEARVRFSHATWYIGMWGAVYTRLR